MKSLERKIIDCIREHMAGRTFVSTDVYGPRDVEAVNAAGALVRVTDNHGLSNDPIHFAKPNCKTCYGRGVVAVRFAKIGAGLDRCGCVEPRRARAAKFLEDLEQAAKTKEAAEWAERPWAKAPSASP